MTALQQTLTAQALTAHTRAQRLGMAAELAELDKPCQSCGAEFPSMTCAHEPQSKASHVPATCDVECNECGAGWNEPGPADGRPDGMTQAKARVEDLACAW